MHAGNGSTRHIQIVQQQGNTKPTESSKLKNTFQQQSQMKIVAADEEAVCDFPLSYRIELFYHFY